MTKKTVRPVSDWVIIGRIGHMEQFSALSRALFERRHLITQDELEAQTGASDQIYIKIRPHGYIKRHNQYARKPLENIGAFQCAALRSDGISYDLTCSEGHATILVGRKDDFQGARPQIGPSHGYGPGDDGNGDRY